jgi:hypothetical protein
MSDPVPDESALCHPGSGGRPSRRLALAAAAAILALTAAGCGASASPVPSATATAATVASPTPAATPAATSTPAASTTPTAAASAATTGHIIVEGQGFGITLPDGWKSIPVDQAGLAGYIATLPADSQLRAILEGQSGAAAQQTIKFWAFDTRPADLASGFARNLNVIVQPASNLSMAVVESAAKASLEAVDAIRKPVATKIVTLPVGQALRIDYVLDVAATDGSSKAVSGTQYYVQLPTATLIVSLSVDEASAAAAVADFDALATSIEAAP